MDIVRLIVNEIGSQSAATGYRKVDCQFNDLYRRAQSVSRASRTTFKIPRSQLLTSLLISTRSIGVLASHVGNTEARSQLGHRKLPNHSPPFCLGTFLGSDGRKEKSAVEGWQNLNLKSRYRSKVHSWIATVEKNRGYLSARMTRALPYPVD